MDLLDLFSLTYDVFKHIIEHTSPITTVIYNSGARAIEQSAERAACKSAATPNRPHV